MNGLRKTTEIYGLHVLRLQPSQSIHANDTGHYLRWGKVKFLYRDPHIAAPVGLKKQFTKTSPTSVNKTAHRCLSGPLKRKRLM